MVNVIVLIIEKNLTTKPRRKEGLEMSRKLRKLRLIAFDEDFVTCSHVITFASAWPYKLLHRLLGHIWRKQQGMLFFHEDI